MNVKSNIKTIIINAIGMCIAIGILYIANLFEPTSYIHFIGGVLFATIDFVMYKATENWKYK